MRRITVVVHAGGPPAHLRDCLTSVMRQSHKDLDVVVVPDGAPESTAVAAEFAGRDERFRVLTQTASTTRAARDLGVAASTGDYLAFVQGRDTLPPRAYEKLLANLEHSGSDFATGKVRALDGSHKSPLPGLGDVFGTSRRRTHVSRFPALLGDDPVTNKLFRRESWLGFVGLLPEGGPSDEVDVSHAVEGAERFRDPVVSVPAHVLARSVDVVPEPVYLARPHDDGSEALYGHVPTQVALRWLRAMLIVSEFLAEHAGSAIGQRYHERVLDGDLARIVRSIDRAPSSDQAKIVAAAADYLDSVPTRLLHRLRAVDRLTCHLLQRRMVPEVVDVLEGRRLGLRGTPVVRRRGRFYAAYPYFEDPAVGVPRHVYRLGRDDLQPVIRLDRVDAAEGRLTVEGCAYVPGIGAPSPHLPRMVALLRHEGGTRRSRIAGTVPLRVERVRRQDVTAETNHPQESLDWSGFRVTLDARRLARRSAALSRWRRGSKEADLTWRLELILQVGTVLCAGAPRPPRGSTARAVPVCVADGRRLLAHVLPAGGLTVRAERVVADLRTHAVGDGHLRVSGRLHRWIGDTPRLRARRKPSGAVHEVPVTVTSPTEFEAALPLDVLSARSGDAAWHLAIAPADGKPARVSAGEDMPESTYRVPRGDRPGSSTELVVDRTRDGNVRVRARTPQAAITRASWSGDRLHLSGTLPARSTGMDDGPVAPQGERILVARNRQTGEEHHWPVDGDGDSFSATICPFGVTSLAGTLPLAAGRWILGLAWAKGRRGKLTPLEISGAAAAGLPDPADHRHKHVALTTSAGHAVLTVSDDLRLDERGAFHQRHLEEHWYPRMRREPLRDAVLYVSFHGEQYSDSPRMIHEELVRRGADVEHLWAVRDGQVQLPPSAVPVPVGSRRHYEALARARYVVVNAHLRPSFRRRDDQVVLQTWHGTPLKTLGYDLTSTRPVTRRYLDVQYRQTRSWQYVLSPNPHSTQVLRQAYGLDGTILEVGYPRNDVFFRPDREVLAAGVRARLNVPDGKRVVLYAPTFRDHVTKGGRRFGLDLRLDLDLLRRALGDDHVLLVRTHRFVIEPVPGDGDGFVTDVSRYPDVAELMLAADVLVTDYSSIMFDFANTGRPMVFFTYDLERYRDDVRGLYFDFETEAPGPLLRTSTEVAEALRDVDAVSAQYRERYRGFAQRYCASDDGHASARVVDRVFGDVLPARSDADLPARTVS